MIAITGTPGVGKTSVCKALGMDFTDLNRLIAAEGFYTAVDKGSLIADLNKLEEYVTRAKPLLIDSHLAHLLKPEVAIVLRANPLLLADRLKQKGFAAEKIAENVDAETLDVILIEAVELCETVYELDTSVKSKEEVASQVREIIDVETAGKSGRKDALRTKYKPGSVDWTSRVCEFGFRDGPAIRNYTKS
ncbi:MAG: adenylate kinase family protein [Halobacteriota archaeon]